MTILKKIIASFLLFTVITACSKSPQYPWYETVLMYHVLVKSFFDSDNDGKGDLKGLISKLDYIRSLNVNTIHMLPITPALNVSNMPRSHYGYEILDFKNVHPDYGTMDDFRTLTQEAHKRGLHIVLDFITTVISVQHPFFQDILNNPDSPYKDWIITSPTIPEGEWMNFNDYKEFFDSAAWQPLPHGGYYYSLWGNSPFLDYHNPKVQEYIFSVVDFWLDAGADGFRIDATKHLFINGPGQEKQYHQPENFEFWKKLRKHITEKYGTDKILIAETVPIPNDVAYITPNREMFDMMFDSTFINEVYPYSETNTDALWSAPYLHSFFENDAVYKLTALKDRLMYHSDHDGARIATRFSEPTEDRLKIAASILILTPAHIKLYAGDETGIKGFSSFADFKNKWFHATVASMAWDNSFNGGFSKSYLPVVPITDDYRKVNVAEQEKRKDSLLNHYRDLMALKKNYPHLFFKGRRTPVSAANDKIYAYLLNYENEAAIVIINLSQKPETFEADLSDYKATGANIIFGDKKTIKAEWNNGKMRIDNLPASGTFVFKLENFDASAFKKNKTSLKNTETVSVYPDNQLHSSKEDIPFVFSIPKQGGLLRLPKGQGKVALTGYSIFETDRLSKTLDLVLDTSAHEVLLPVLPDKTTVFFFKKDGISFTFTDEDPKNALPPDLPLLASNDGNINMSGFYAGKDDNFWYFKMDRKGDILPSNGGLDFILFINTQEKRSLQKVSFWHLPEVTSKIPVNALILYERHIRTGKVQTDINSMRSIGVARNYKHLIFDHPDYFIALVARDVFPQSEIRVAPFVWSAGGVWGDKPPKDKQWPIVERLPFDPEKEYRPYLIEDFLKVN